MVAKTRSQTKHEREENNRKNPVFNLLKLIDTAMVFFEENLDLSAIGKLDLPELSLALAAMPLPEDERKILIDSAQFYA